LPALNALLNGLSATALLIGYTFIRARRIAAHRAAMMTAFGFSTLFLVSYILHHALHGDVRYPRTPLCARSTCRCWPATSFWPSWRCRWCWSLSFSRSAGDSAAPQGCPLDLSAVALCLGHRRRHLCDAAPGELKFRGKGSGVRDQENLNQFFEK
jgi:hypothetical protein